MLPEEPFRQQVGVPTSPSTTWGLLKFRSGKVFPIISPPTKIGLNMEKIAVKCENKAVLGFVLALCHNFFNFEHICVYLGCQKKIGIIATPLPPNPRYSYLELSFFVPNEN